MVCNHEVEITALLMVWIGVCVYGQVVLLVGNASSKSRYARYAFYEMRDLMIFIGASSKS